MVRCSFFIHFYKNQHTCRVFALFQYLCAAERRVKSAIRELLLRMNKMIILWQSVGAKAGHLLENAIEIADGVKAAALRDLGHRRASLLQSLHGNGDTNGVEIMGKAHAGLRAKEFGKVGLAKMHLRGSFLKGDVCAASLNTVQQLLVAFNGAGLSGGAFHGLLMTQHLRYQLGGDAVGDHAAITVLPRDLVKKRIERRLLHIAAGEDGGEQAIVTEQLLKVRGIQLGYSGHRSGISLDAVDLLAVQKGGISLVQGE